MMVAEELGAWALGCYGNAEARTPNIDTLARSGVRFLYSVASPPALGPGSVSGAETVNDPEAALAFLDRQGQGKPFALYAGMKGTPEVLDAAVQKIMARLNQRGLRDSTVVVFTSRIGVRKAFHPPGATSLGDDLLLTPLLLSWYGKTPSELVRAEVVAAYNLAPTLNEATGAAPAAGPCGRGFLRLATNTPLRKKETWPTTAFAKLGDARIARDSRYKLIVRDGGTNELYDVRVDGQEKTNQFENAAFVTVKNRLRRELDVWLKGCGK